MKEHSNDRDKAEQSAHQRKNRGKGRAKRVWGVIGTIVLVGVLTMAIFVGIFMTYINKSLKGHVEVDMSEYDRKVSTELYRLGTDGETWEMYQTLFSDENRIWVDIGDIPEYLQEATIAIEDKRFKTHHGVDWKGTLRAITRTLTGSGTQGGSTITQQLLKNVTGDNQVTVKRKITEIYRALALEKDYSKSQILEMYLNTIYLGEQCYGVQTAARMYFHKDVKDLTLAECACLIGITNNPSMYDPLLSDWARENNRERQLTILGEMLGQEKIDQATYDAAVAEEVQFSDGYTNLGNFTEPTEDQETPEKPTVQSTANNSYYTDQVISDVAAALVEKLTGMDMLDYLRKKVLRRVGFSEEAYILKDPYGVSQGGSGLVSKLSDLAGIAMLCCRGGVLDGEQLIPADFLREATACQVPTNLQPTFDEQLGYGFMMWKTRYDGFAFYGMGGQLALCYPERDLVFLTMADTIGNPAGLQMIYDCFYDTVYPAVTGMPEYTNTQKLPAGERRRGVEHWHFYGMQDKAGAACDSSGWETVVFDWEQRIIILVSAEKTYEWYYGDDTWEYQKFPETDYTCMCRGQWMLGHFVFHSFLIDEEEGHVAMDFAWKGNRMSARLVSTSEPPFVKLKGFWAAEQIE